MFYFLYLADLSIFFELIDCEDQVLFVPCFLIIGDYWSFNATWDSTELPVEIFFEEDLKPKTKRSEEVLAKMKRFEEVWGPEKRGKKPWKKIEITVTFFIIFEAKMFI